MDRIIQELYNNLSNYDLGNRSSVKHLWSEIRDNHLEDAIRNSIESMIAGAQESTLLTRLLSNVGRQIYTVFERDNQLSNVDQIRLGQVVVNAMVSCKMIKVEKLPIINRKKNVQEMYVYTVISSELLTAIRERTLPRLKANLGYHQWIKPTMFLESRKIDIVKRASIFGLLHNYRYDQMPDRYYTLNRLAQTKWKINQKMLKVLDRTPADDNLLPKPITEEERVIATRALNKAARIAISIEDQKYIQLINEGYDKETAKKFAVREADNYESYKGKEYKDILSKWSKHQDFINCLSYAKEYGDDTLNFIYSFDSRGRAYVVNQALLNPQGADHAKSLLSFNRPKQVSTWDLKITLANHAGEDKVSYDDRIKWVDENEANILEVGKDPWSTQSMSWLVSSGISTEKKSKFQFIATCLAYYELALWITETGSDEGFLCDIPVAYDATNSGLQILSAIGRDDYVAPYVNITSTAKPGDIYQLIGTAVAKKKPVEKLEILPSDSKAWRKIVKRNVMTKNYAATRYGMGTQQWEDKPAKQDDDTNVWHTLTFAECRKLGETTYDTCTEYLTKASQLMETMKYASSFNKDAVITWKLPDGFLAFQAKPKFKKEQIRVVVGETLKLVLQIPQKEADSRAHASAIAPDVVHSLDAWLLSNIINKLPSEANLAFVHDAFGSDSVYGATIQECAKEAYYETTSRTVMSLILEQIAGQPIELPSAGNWVPEEIFKADYIVC